MKKAEVIKALRVELRQTQDQLEDVSRRQRLGVKRTMRLTNLLRKTLPKDTQEGCGLEGMIESLLALLVSLQRT